MKSSRSSTFEPPPSGWKPERRLNPSAHGSERTNTSPQQAAQAFCRVQPWRSIVIARMFSQTARTVENAANVMKTKKSVPQIRPPGIGLKTFGSVLKMRPGPEKTASAWPEARSSARVVPPARNAEQAGKMMRPATIATNVSRHATVADSPSSVRSRPT